MRTAIFAAALLAGAALALSPGEARAADVVSLHEDVVGYYEGERTSAYVAFGLGAAAAGTGAYLLTRKTDLASGAGWLLVTMGALEAIGAAGYAVDVTGKKAHYEELVARDPAAFQREEAAHIHGTTSRFFAYRLVELGLTLGGAGLATYGFVAGKDTWKGAGVALAAVGLPLLVMDTINNERALRYERAVQSLQPSVSVGREGAFGLAIRGSL